MSRLLKSVFIRGSEEEVGRMQSAVGSQEQSERRKLEKKAIGEFRSDINKNLSIKKVVNNNL